MRMESPLNQRLRRSPPDVVYTPIDVTSQTRSFVRTMKAAARRKYTSEEKIRIVLEGFRREVTVNDC